MDKKDKYNDIFDHMLKYAAEQKMDEMVNDIPLIDETNQYRSYSSEFKSRMDSFLGKVKRKGHSLRIRRVILKCAVMVVVFIVVSTAVIYNVEALRVPFLNLFIENGDESITIHVRDDKENYDAFGDQIKGMCLPTYLPDNYKTYSLDKTDTLSVVVYKNTDGDEIILQKLYEGYTVVKDIEDVIIKDFTVNDEPAQFFEKNGMRTLIYKYDGNIFLMNGIISEDELVQVAESMEFYP